MTGMERKPRLDGFLFCWVWSLLSAINPLAGQDTDLPRVEFNRDIRPILSNNCFTCHGPDERQRQVNLRLDTREGIFAERGGYRMVAPENPDESRLLQRISADTEAQRMPPSWSGKELTPDQIDLIRNWIEQGAKWRQHWAFSPLQQPPLPPVGATDWPRNGIDYFALARMQREGLKPSPEADGATLIRRLTLDLTGLPPTPSEIDAFLNDQSPDAYEKQVERLLASPRYGERMAWPWLEAARYADSNGYQSDGERYMWRWRDWVIAALNENMSFDQFTVEQIAGDMLPGATLDQKIATGFNRNHRANGEGGIIPEEYAVEYVVDRVNTTSTVWLGLTMGCARCHDHKYDPVTQKEFYEFFAFFNNVPEKGKANKHGNSPPMIKAPTPEQQVRLRELEKRAAAAEERFADLGPNIAAAQAKWEGSPEAAQPADWTITRGLVARYPLDGDIQGEFKEESTDPPEAQLQEGEAVFVTGLLEKAASFDGRRFIEAGDIGDFGFLDKLSLGAWVYFSDVSDGIILSRMDDTDESRGYSLGIKEGKIQLNLSARRLDDSIRVETVRSLPAGQWHHVLGTYDGSRVASGVTIYIDGQAEKLEVLLDALNQSFNADEPLRIGARGGDQSRFRGYVDEVGVYAAALRSEEAAILATPDSIDEIAAIPRTDRSPQQVTKLRRYFLQRQAPASLQQAWQDLVHRRQERDQFAESIPTTMVMAERAPPGDTFILGRGQYDNPGARVDADVPAILPPLPSGQNNDRLGLARWLVDASNPLTARVTVNRFWQMHFGAGLVRSPENFGSRGEPPTHPQLLDWLAAEFVRTGWDMKALHKTIVMSATYRQSSRLTPELLKTDPENRLLARGPRLRLSAGVIRDQALAVSGLLVEKLGGPSVRPYQPAGLWKELSDLEGYTQGSGQDLYRRSLYTFWKRTIPPPVMATFDASARETCVVRETRTNTPLQALTLMNDVTFVEAARVLAQRMMSEGRDDPSERIRLGFRLATARTPGPRELEVLRAGLNHHLAEYRKDPVSASKLISIGESSPDGELEVSELAAYTAVANLILNLDETVTKE